MRGARSSVVPWAAVLLGFTFTASVAAQTNAGDSAAAESAPRGVTPRGAMIRSMLVPGLGQASVGSNHRGAVFFALRGTAAYMIFRTLGRLDEVRGIETRLVGFATDSLNALMATDSLAAERLSDPVAFTAAVDAFRNLGDTRALVRAREQQRQDWFAYAIFFTLIDGIDAYVNAHFRDFPVSIEGTPAAGGGGSLRLTVPVPWGGAPPPPRPRSRAQGRPPGSR